jgi:cyclin B
MASQTDITDRMRAILVDWLIDVHLKFKLRHETVRLTSLLARPLRADANAALPHNQHLGSVC